MRILIRDGSGVKPALRTHVERRLGLALGRFGTRVSQVAVRFSDVGAEKRCEIRIALRPVSMCVEDVQRTAHAAVDRAGERAAALIDRALERERALAGAVPPVEPLARKRQ